MTIPNCYDPVLQEERRQAKWDKLINSLPKCDACNARILTGQKFHTAGGLTICRDCMEVLKDNIDIVEESE